MIYREDMEILEEIGKDIGNKKFIDTYQNKVINRSEVTGKILKYLRSRIGITQREIAQKIGIAQQTYAGYESGKHEPNIETIIRLADVYRISMDYITGRYWGHDEDRAADEHIEMEEYLESTVEHYQIQRQSDLEFMKAIKRRSQA